MPYGIYGIQRESMGEFPIEPQKMSGKIGDSLA
jgi:hypothetical protein